MPKTTKKQIITTAKELFSVYNYDSVSMNDIAEKLKKILSLFLELKLCKNKKNECHNMIIMQKLSKHDENATIFLKKAKNQLYKTLSPLFDEIIEKNNNLKNIKKEFLFLLIFGTINSYALNKAMLNEEVLNKKEVINYIIKLILK